MLSLGERSGSKERYYGAFKVKALLLAAGLGTRLRPLTNDRPKCLVEINGRPILDYWICHLIEDIHCSDVIVNVHHLHNQVREFVEEHKYRNLIKIFFEPKLLDTAGTVNSLIHVLGDEFIIVHADNFVSLSIYDFVYSKWRSNNSLLKALCIETESPQHYGIFSVDDNGDVVDFNEKPVKSESNIANGAIYVANRNFSNYVKSHGVSGNISLDVIPNIANFVEVYMFSGVLMDIGTPEQLELVNRKIDLGEITAWGRKSIF